MFPTGTFVLGELLLHRDANDCSCMPYQFGTFFVVGIPLGKVAELTDHLVEGIKTLVRKMQSRSLDQFQYRTRVDNRRKTAGIVWLAIGHERFQAGFYESGEGVPGCGCFR